MTVAEEKEALRIIEERKKLREEKKALKEIEKANKVNTETEGQAKKKK